MEIIPKTNKSTLLHEGCVHEQQTKHKAFKTRFMKMNGTYHEHMTLENIEFLELHNLILGICLLAVLSNLSEAQPSATNTAISFTFILNITISFIHPSTEPHPLNGPRSYYDNIITHFSPVRYITLLTTGTAQFRNRNFFSHSPIVNVGLAGCGPTPAAACMHACALPAVVSEDWQEQGADAGSWRWERWRCKEAEGYIIWPLFLGREQ